MPGARQSYREPMFKAPWPATALAGALVVAYLVQAFLLPDAWVLALALTAEGVREGRWYQLASHELLQAGIGNVLINAVMVFAFGTPVARFFGRRPGDGVLFYAFFLMCGAVGGLAHLALTWESSAPLVGASAAVAGLFGGATRLMVGGGTLAKVSDPRVISTALAVTAIIATVGVLGFLVSAVVSWQAQIAAYLAGLLLIEVFGRIARRG